MLKAQRHPRSQEVTLTMSRTRSSLQSRTLWLALAIALALHLAALVLFRLPILKIYSLPPTSTAWVEFDPSGTSSAEATWLPHASPLLLPSHLLIDRETLPTAHLPLSHQQALANAHQRLLLPSFQQAEGLENMALFIPSPLPQGTRTWVQVHVSGPLAEWPLVDDGNDTSIPTPISDCCLRYSVKVDVQRGEVCWYTLLTPAQIDTQRLADTIVQNMRFAKDDVPSLLTGEVEIHFQTVRELKS